MKKIILIDGNWLFNSMFFATKRQRELWEQNSPEKPFKLCVNNFLFKVIKFTDNYDSICVCFDNKEKTIRSELFPEYKMNRKKEKEKWFLEQLELIKIGLDILKIPNITIPRYEADDIIGTLSTKYDNGENLIHLYSLDNDLKQLITNNTKILKSSKVGNKTTMVEYGIEEFKKEYSPLLEPKDLITIKAIGGDSSDNYKGLKGIGTEGIIRLLERYKSLEGIFDHANFLKSKIKEKGVFTNTLLSPTKINSFLDNTQEIELLLKLSTIITDVPIGTFDISFSWKNIDKKVFENFCKENDFNKLWEIYNSYYDLETQNNFKNNQTKLTF
ncbi:MAG: 5'-3' exonuclease [Mycoplasma sp.]